MCGVAMTMYVLWTSGELQHCLALPSRETFTRLQNTSIHVIFLGTHCPVGFGRRSRNQISADEGEDLIAIIP